jgi:hypothetical protein
MKQLKPFTVHLYDPGLELNIIKMNNINYHKVMIQDFNVVYGFFLNQEIKI